MASLSTSRCLLHAWNITHSTPLCGSGIWGRSNRYNKVGFWISATSNYHTVVNRWQRGCIARVESGRVASPCITAVVLSPPHLTPQYRQLSSVNSVFQKIFTVSATSPLPEEMTNSSPDTTITMDVSEATTHTTLDSQTLQLPDVAAESISATQTVTESIVYIPPPPAPPEVLGPALNALGEATFQSLGLGGWTPVGIMQNCLEYLHISANLPWWATIAIATVMLRTMIFPLVLKSQRNAAKMHNNLPQLQVLQMKMSEARNSGDQLNAARYGQEMMQFMKEKEMSPFKNILVPIAQAPIFISMFMSLRKLANLPLESFKDGGILWFTDLTVCDPYYILPVITSCTMLATIELGTDGARLNSQNMHMMKYVLRGLPLFIFPFTINFPAAVLCYWVSTNLFSLVQVGVLKIPAIRDYFKIDKMVDHKKETLPEKKGFVEGFQDSWRNMKVSREIADRANYDSIRFRKAGSGPVTRTYKQNPTKVIDVQAKVRDAE
ncbi:hypothetical protein Pcinc_022892 [Petrolisthes cinctipes]|uniref:Membrane insertase YidC/Oxa/ALB C-terminal domain-containing protein n=1 Tax=Petrolisthes cinctipes TaxID=88211 RepID=A0AAE1KF80_PETCI|nr:hypothetical protein Pcinc_022892 [Petrolisthes cinctipes]